MTSKHCIKCKRLKPLTEFYKKKTAKNGYCGNCKPCKKIYAKQRDQSKNGLVAKWYSHQKENSISRNHKPPAYTLYSLRSWALNQSMFHELYRIWVASGFNTEKSPSIDRLDDYKGYAFDNIRLVTWLENKQKGYSDRRNGINNKDSKAVLQFSAEGLVIEEHHSMCQAERVTGVGKGGISGCCKGKQNTAGGFVWCYV